MIPSGARKNNSVQPATGAIRSWRRTRAAYRRTRARRALAWVSCWPAAWLAKPNRYAALNSFQVWFQIPRALPLNASNWIFLMTLELKARIGSFEIAFLM